MMRRLRAVERLPEGELGSPPKGTGKRLRRSEAWTYRLVVSALVFSDVLLAVSISFWALVLAALFGSGALTQVAILGTLATTAVWVGLRTLFGLYPGYGLDPVAELRRQTYAVAVTLSLVATFAVALQLGDSFSRLTLVASFAGLAVLAPITRHLTKRVLRRVRFWGKPVVILREGQAATSLARTLQGEWGLGFNPVAYFDDRGEGREEPLEGLSYGGPVHQAEAMVRHYGVDTAIVVTSQVRDEELADLVDWAGSVFPRLIVVPSLGGVAHSAVVARDLAGTFGVEIKHNLLAPWVRRTKRALDLFGVLAGGAAITPLLLALVVLVKLDSPGPVFYAQRRLGTENRGFRCWKFRTMRLDAEKALEEYLQSDPDLRAEWEINHKLRKDPRVTRTGRFLRDTSLDELPQIWNVLKGEMSLVGPRPIVDAEVPKYGNVYGLYRRVRPGISGFWQVSGRSDTTYDERVAMDAYYVRNWSVWLDVVILARTVTSVLLRRGAR